MLIYAFNIRRILSITSEKHQYYILLDCRIVMEYCNLGSLSDHLIETDKSALGKVKSPNMHAYISAYEMVGYIWSCVGGNMGVLWDCCFVRYRNTSGIVI